MCENCCCEEVQELRERLEEDYVTREEFERVQEEKDEEIQELREELRQVREEKSEENDDLARRISKLEGGQATLRKKVEGGSADPEGRGNGSEDASPPSRVANQEPETPLEELIRLPETMADENLTANQERARFVAKDVQEYARGVPAGYAIKSSELRRVLIAKDGRTGGHNETVYRVMDQLDDFGKSDVTVRESRSGDRVVVFSDEIVSRIASFGKGARASNDVVTGATG